MRNVPCQACSRGTMERKRVYRLNGFLALAGWILLIPSAFCFLSSAILFVAGAVGAGIFATAGRDANPVADSTALRVEMEEALIPDLFATDDVGLFEAQVAQARLLEEAAVAHRLDPFQLDPVQHKRNDEAARLAVSAAAFGGFSAVALFTFAVLGAIPGALLTMKKTVLRCSYCSATIQAV